MTIAGTMSSALSGLKANARAAEIVSSNIANAMTEGYGRREIILAARQAGSTGQGVLVVGVHRHSDPALIADRRLAAAEAGHHRVQAEFLKRLETVVGSPEQAQSLSGRMAALDTALIAASSRPESDARLAEVADSARALVQQLDTVSDDIQAARTAADDRIEAGVAQLNTALARVADLNRQIRASSGGGRDASALVDQRQQAIDQIAALVPVREIDRGNGQVALVTTGGAILLDGRAGQFGFTPVGQITPGMTTGSGALSGLTLNGKPLATTADRGPIAGGTLSADFRIRDQLAPDAQAQIDAIARELVERFAAPGLDASRAPGDPGLFTDAGAAFNPANEVGLSQRLRLNQAADPEAGGALWRLRDGLGAAVPGAVGNGRLLNDWQAALSALQDPASATLPVGKRSLSGLVAEVTSAFAGARLTAEGEASFAGARADTLLTLELDGGVDSDNEIQTLLMIEQNYAANARVVQTVDDMIKLLLGI